MTNKTHKNRNKNTTNREIVNMALSYWDAIDHIRKASLTTNLNSYWRDRNNRLIARMTKEAIELGSDLEVPNADAFTSMHSTTLIARQFGLLD